MGSVLVAGRRSHDAPNRFVIVDRKVVPRQRGRCCTHCGALSSTVGTPEADTTSHMCVREIIYRIIAMTFRRRFRAAFPLRWCCALRRRPHPLIKVYFGGAWVEYTFTFIHIYRCILFKETLFEPSPRPTYTFFSGWAAV